MFFPKLNSSSFNLNFHQFSLFFCPILTDYAIFSFLRSISALNSSISPSPLIPSLFFNKNLLHPRVSSSLLSPYSLPCFLLSNPISTTAALTNLPLAPLIRTFLTLPSGKSSLEFSGKSSPELPETSSPELSEIPSPEFSESPESPLPQFRKLLETPSPRSPESPSPELLQLPVKAILLPEGELSTTCYKSGSVLPFIIGLFSSKQPLELQNPLKTYSPDSPESPKTSPPESPKTSRPELPKTPLPESPKTPWPESPKTPWPESPKTPWPESPKTHWLESPESPEGASVTRGGKRGRTGSGSDGLLPFIISLFSSKLPEELRGAVWPWRKSLLIVVSGPSGSGKSSIIKKLTETRKDLRRVVSVTSREKREWEMEGRDYAFVTKEEFLCMVERGELLEYSMVYGHYKGIPRHKIWGHMAAGEDVVVKVDVQGAAKLRSIYGRAAVLVFVAAESEAAGAERLIDRKTENSDDLLVRTKAAKEELVHARFFDYVVVNATHTLSAAALLVESIIYAEKAKLVQ